MGNSAIDWQCGDHSIVKNMDSTTFFMLQQQKKMFRRNDPHRMQKIIAGGITIAYLITIAIILFLQLTLLENLVKHSFVGPAGWNASPMLFLATVLALWFWIHRSDTPKTLQWQKWQIIAGGIGFLIAVFLAYWATHPSLERFMATHLFIQTHPVSGGPLIAGLLYAALFLPIIPALLLCIPWNVLKNAWMDLFLLLILFFLSLFVPVLDALYHMAVSPFILASVYSLLQPLGEASTEPQQLRLGFRGFEVIVGPVCSGLNMLALFTAFFGFLWMRMHQSKQHIHHLRMISILGTGLTMLFFLNILRITIVMIIGSMSPSIGLLLFHTSAGLLLLLLVCIACWKWAMDWSRPS